MRKIKLSGKQLRILLMFLFVCGMAIISFAIVGIIIHTRNKDNTQNPDNYTRNYHVVILGTNENQSFLQKVYEGAKAEGDFFNTVVELYVPDSKAQDLSLKNLFDYATFVNADGIIAYIDSPEEVIPECYRMDNSIIPLVTTGHFASGVKQISFIGNNYWELGNTIGTETAAILNNSGKAYIISSENYNSSTYSNMTNSVQTKLKNHPEIEYQVAGIEEIEKGIDLIIRNTLIKEAEKSQNVSFVCMNEEDTLKMAQLLTEKNISNNSQIKLIGFGNNETCQYYLNKGVITELISLDPLSIGHSAICELFEYRNKGYANSYIAANVIIQKQGNK